MAFCRNSAILASVFLLISSQCWGQNQDGRDNELWTGVSLKYDLNKKVQFGLDQQVRINNNVSTLRSNFFELGARYKWNKHFATKFQYRYTLRTGQRNVHRYTLDNNIKWKWKKPDLKFDYRLRVQHAMVAYTGQPSTYLRNRMRMSYYGFKKIEPFVSCENFFKFIDHNEFRGNRYMLGCEVKLNKQLDLTLMYGIDQEINTKNPDSRNIYAATLTFGF